MGKPNPLSSRSSGLLLHVSSLPGGCGIGDFGNSAFEFVDFLARSRQRWWQILPIEAVGATFSPYQALSAFAGNPLFINLDEWVSAGWLPRPKVSKAVAASVRVAYPEVQHLKEEAARRAFQCFRRKGRPRVKRAVREFCQSERHWLDDYALFRALQGRHPGMAWTEWPEELRSREPAALASARKLLAAEIEFHQFIQFTFFDQWSRVRSYAARKGIGIIGDLPIFVAHDSADVWAHPELFNIDRAGRLLSCAGVPPDYFSAEGQKWGNPLYRWNVLRASNYGWWIDRLRAGFEKYDVIRVDHFIGFQRHWEVPASAPTARHGRWRTGPSDDFFRAIFKQLGRVPLIAEDLGLLTPEVMALRDRWELPGMNVLQFAFNPDPGAEPSRPHHFRKNSVVYPGTHDNNTTRGWFAEADRPGFAARTRQRLKRERDLALRYMHSDGTAPHWDMIRLAWMNRANTAITPLQDLLGLGSSGRMNTPGTSSGNWEWRLEAGALSASLARRLRELTVLYGRAGAPR